VIISAFRARNITPWIAQEASHLVASVNLVSAGFGLTIVPQSLSAMKLRGVVYRELVGPNTPQAPLRLAYTKTGQSEAALNLIKLLRRNFGA